MRKGQTVDYDRPVIRHRMMDGRVLDSIDGIVIPKGHEFYKVALEIAEERRARREKAEAMRAGA